jgi:hypothetical protein
MSFSSYGNDDVYLCAPSGRPIVDETISRSAFVTLVNSAGKTICNKLAYALFSNLSTIPFDINDTLDLKKCFVEFASSTLATDSVYFVLVQEAKNNSIQLLNKYRVDVPVTYNETGRFYFSPENFLKTKKIKAITLDESTNSQSAFLYLQTKDDRVINGVNLSFFASNPRNHQSKNIQPIQLNNVEIQFKDSFIEVTNPERVSKVILYFYY